MEDVTMMNIICDEDIIKEFESFNIRIEDNKLLEKLKNICLINDITAEKLVSEWLGFCNKKKFTEEINFIKLDLFDKEDFRQKVFQLENSAKETKFKNEKLMQVENDILNDYGIDDFNSKLYNTKTIENNINDFNKENTKVNLEECILENTLNETVELIDDNEIQLVFGKKLCSNDWINIEHQNFNLKPLNPEFHITKPFKSLKINIHECNDIMNEDIDNMRENIKEKLKNLQLENLNDSQFDEIFVGRILVEKTNFKVDKNLIYFQSCDDNINRMLLDLSNLKEYYLFSGKIVAIFGTIKNNILIVNEFYDEKLEIPSFSKYPLQINKPLYIMFASGPIAINNSDDLSILENLLNQVKVFQPSFLILMGSFFDCRNDYLLINCDGTQFFNKVMTKISSALKNIQTESIIIPSIYDLNNYNSFPAPPFEQNFPKIKFMPNPSFLNINGVIIALSSIDIVKHLFKEEISNSFSNNVEKVCEHLLSQKSLYPLFPPSDEINLEYSKLNFIKFNVKPHLFLLTSIIKHFVVNVDDSIFINPECLSEGYYSKIKIDMCGSKDYAGSLKPFTSVEIIKIKKKNKN